MKRYLDKYTDKQILERLVKIYPDQRKCVGGYRKVLTLLRRFTPKPYNLTIVPNKYDTYGKGGDGERFAIDFTPWQEWLGMPVQTKTNGLTALCYCLWEMTYHGFDQRGTQSILSELKRRIKSIDGGDE